jgi:hypothetical protein
MHVWLRNVVCLRQKMLWKIYENIVNGRVAYGGSQLFFISKFSLKMIFMGRNMLEKYYEITNSY